MQQDSNRFAHIDALRAIAALLVVWRHAADAFMHLWDAQPSWLHALATQLDVGVIGVVLFFGISGYVIPASLREPHSLPRFAVSRFFRLYPAFWLSILPGAYTSYWIWNFPFSWREVLLNLTMIPEALGARPAIGLYWTLWVELIFYTLCALLAACGLLRRTGVLMVAIAALVLLNIRMQPAVAAPLFLAIMFFGAILRSYHDGISRSSRTLLFLVLSGGGLAIAWPAYAFFDAGPDTFRFAFPIALGMSIFLLGSTVIRIRVRLLAWLGLISYSIYLFHPVVFNLQLKWMTTAAPAWLYHLPMGFHIASTVVLTSALAAAVYYSLERPMIRFGRNRMRSTARGGMAAASAQVALSNPQNAQ